MFLILIGHSNSNPFVGPHVPTHTSDHNYMSSHTRPTYSKKLTSSFNQL